LFCGCFFRTADPCRRHVQSVTGWKPPCGEHPAVRVRPPAPRHPQICSADAFFRTADPCRRHVRSVTGWKPPCGEHPAVRVRPPAPKKRDLLCRSLFFGASGCCAAVRLAAGSFSVRNTLPGFPSPILLSRYPALPPLRVAPSSEGALL